MVISIGDNDKVNKALMVRLIDELIGGLIEEIMVRLKGG